MDLRTRSELRIVETWTWLPWAGRNRPPRYGRQSFLRQFVSLDFGSRPGSKTGPRRRRYRHRRHGRASQLLESSGQQEAIGTEWRQKCSTYLRRWDLLYN